MTLQKRVLFNIRIDQFSCVNKIQLLFQTALFQTIISGRAWSKRLFIFKNNGLEFI